MNNQPWTIDNLRNAPCTASDGVTLSDRSISETALLPHPTRLFVETTTRCNLRCQMCLKQTEGSGLEEGDLSMETFLALKPAMANAEALMLNGIGEPLLHPDLEEFIRIAKEAMPAESWIGFQSNGLLLDEKRAHSLVEAGLDRICISVDSVSDDTFRNIREGEELLDIQRAFAALDSARKSLGRPLRIGFEFVVMEDNLHELPSTLRWAAARGADFGIVSHLLPYAAEFVSKAAFDPNTDQAIRLFEEWQQRAADQGIDMTNYFEVALLRMRHTPEEERMIAFVREMLAAARRQDIFLNLRYLLGRDPAKAVKVEQIFAETQRLADELGIELRLPAVTPRLERSCDFVERGGVFIAWDGRVHPCYFLWHKFACFFTDRKKYVTPVSFGNVHERGILDIWNDPAYRAFRTDELRHEYPFCTNCGLTPCEYIYCEEFEQDCYGNTIPCGDCFWAMGLFNCMQ